MMDGWRSFIPPLSSKRPLTWADILPRLPSDGLKDTAPPEVGDEHKKPPTFSRWFCRWCLSKNWSSSDYQHPRTLTIIAPEPLLGCCPMILCRSDYLASLPLRSFQTDIAKTFKTVLFLFRKLRIDLSNDAVLLDSSLDIKSSIKKLTKCDWV